MKAVKVRPLDASEQRAFRLARLVAAEKMPYFMHALFAASPLAAEGLGTFAVDKHWRLYMDPAMLLGPGAWPSPVAGAVLIHEVGHLIRDHAGRAEQLPQPCVHIAWNYAGDAEINDDLIGTGIDLPEYAVTPAALGQPPNLLAEDYYRALALAMENATPDGDPGCGSGSGCEPVPGELGPDTDLAGEGIPLAGVEGELVRHVVARDVKDYAAAKGRGTLPAGLERWADEVLAVPTVPWSRVLRAVVRRAVAQSAGRTDYTYSRPSRRRVRGVILPAMRGPRVGVSIVVDTSGSMSQADLAAALGEISGVLSASGLDRDQVRVMSCDATTLKAKRVRSVRDIELVGGGGTDMRVGIAAALAIRPKPHVVIVLTDGDTPWPEAPIGAALICAVIRDRAPSGTPPWAATVHIPPAGP